MYQTLKQFTDENYLHDGYLETDQLSLACLKAFITVMKNLKKEVFLADELKNPRPFCYLEVSDYAECILLGSARASVLSLLPRDNQTAAMGKS